MQLREGLSPKLTLVQPAALPILRVEAEKRQVFLHLPLPLRAPLEEKMKGT